jgi:hypothetical protein
VKEELLETRHAGPGEAARREVGGTKTGPTPSRWTLRTSRASVDWLPEYTVSGVGRVVQPCGLGLHNSCARLFSPDPDYMAARGGGGTAVCAPPRASRRLWSHGFWTSLAITVGQRSPRRGDWRPP